MGIVQTEKIFEATINGIKVQKQLHMLLFTHLKVIFRLKRYEESVWIISSLIILQRKYESYTIKKETETKIYDPSKQKSFLSFSYLAIR